MQNYSLKKYDVKINTQTISWCCFIIVCLANMWALWNGFSVLDTIYTLTSVFFFGIAFLLLLFNFNNVLKSGIFICYIGFIIWSLIMIIAYDYCYPTHGDQTFLFFTMDSYALSFIRMFIVIFPGMIFIDYNEAPSGKYNKLAIFIILVILISSSLFMSRALVVNPDAVRARGTMDALGYANLLVGVPDYGHVYGYSLLIPVFLYKFNTTKCAKRFCYGLIIALMLYIIVFSQFATALLIAISGVLIYFLITANSKNRIIAVLLAVVFFVIVVFMDGGADIFLWLSERVDGAWSIKLEDIASTLSGEQDSGMVSSRAEVYSESFNSFLASPFLGKFLKNFGKIGGHATAIDVLGLSGICGFLFFATTIYGNYLRMKSFCKNTKESAVVITCTIQFILLVFLKNVISAMSIFFAFYILLPLLIKVSEDGEEIDKKNNIQQTYSAGRKNLRR